MPPAVSGGIRGRLARALRPEPRHELAAAPAARLSEDGRDVDLHRGLGAAQRARDGLVRPSERQQARDLRLAWREPVARGGGGQAWAGIDGATHLDGEEMVLGTGHGDAGHAERATESPHAREQARRDERGRALACGPARAVGARDATVRPDDEGSGGDLLESDREGGGLRAVEHQRSGDDDCGHGDHPSGPEQAAGQRRRPAQDRRSSRRSWNSMEDRARRRMFANVS